jgi:peptidoglycan/xylan/chitin deacetylase (PgdA/CDA1 family)
MKLFYIVSFFYVLGLVLLIAFNMAFLFIILLTLLYIGIITYGVTNISAQFFIPAYCSAKSSKREVAITFDDGPDKNNTRALLDLLKKYNATAAFFVIGQEAEKHRELLETIHNCGHLIGNHSYSHSNLFPVLPVKKIMSEISKCNAVIESVTGEKCNWFRPPFGVINTGIAKAVKRKGLRVSGWSIRTFDTTKRRRSKILQKVERNLKNGEVILLHDSTEDILWLTEEILKLARARNLKVVSVDKLFGF